MQAFAGKQKTVALRAARPSPTTVFHLPASALVPKVQYPLECRATALDKPLCTPPRMTYLGLELAAEGRIDAAPERVRRVLIDYPSHHSWQQRLKESRVLARGVDCLDVYQRLQLPVIDDRDFTLHVTWGNDAKVLWLRFATANAQGPAPVNGVVRVTEQEGGWRLEPADGGLATQAIYRFHMDLAGSVPSGMGHGQAANALPELFTSITKQLPGYR